MIFRMSRIPPQEVQIVVLLIGGNADRISAQGRIIKVGIFAYWRAVFTRRRMMRQRSSKTI
jgi:hypothetical protein